MTENSKGPIVFVMIALFLLSLILPVVLTPIAVYTNQILIWQTANVASLILEILALLGAIALAGGITKEQYFRVVRLLPLL